VTRGKAWTVDEELKLKALLEAGLPVPIIATRLSKTEVAVVLKVSRLGLKDDKKGEKLLLSSSSGELELPVELPTVEEAGKILGGALLAMMRPGSVRRICGGGRLWRMWLGSIRSSWLTFLIIGRWRRNMWS
jgi:hypothetical protein